MMNESTASSRDKILEVAEALYARRGFAGVGMREVAEAAGLGKSSLFHHFRSKAQLYLGGRARRAHRKT
jgi:TetR/AcrR family transcriptional regulator